jgi:hypothetical protein
MAVTITADEIVRRTLHQNRLPLHYYIQFLSFLKQGLKEFQLTLLPTMTTVLMPLDANFECTLPSDFVEEIAVYEAVGDKMAEVPHSELVSSFDYPAWVSGTTYQIGDIVNSGGFTWKSLTVHTDAVAPVSGAIWALFTKFATIPNIYSESSGTDLSGGLYYSVHGEDTGSLFGYTQVDNRGYRILREYNKIRFDNNTTIGQVYMRYITMPVKVNNQTLIHPMLEMALVEFINWQKSKYWRFKDADALRVEFYNKRRHVKSMLNPLNITDIISTFRKNISQSIKS